MPNLRRSLWVLLLSCIGAMGRTDCRAQSTPSSSTKDGTLTGVVSDPSGAKVQRAAVHVEGSGLQRDTTTDSSGRFTLTLPAGSYDVTIVSAGFDPYVATVKLAGQPPHATMDAKLVIATQTEEVEVPADNSSTSAADNRSAMVFKGDGLKAFSDDNGTFQQEVLALAGGTGEKPPQIFVDGFSNGRFPPKNTIREIRINQNPYSAQYDDLGFGRVEIFTKPGADKLHGNFTSSGNDDVFNGRNPYTTVEPPYYVLNLDGNISGAINKKTSFFVSGTYNDLQNNAIVDAIDPNSLAPLSEAVPAPQRTQTYSGRLDRQVTTNNTLTGRYEYNQASLTNNGVGLLVLPSEGLNSTTTTHTLQLTDTQLFGSKIVSEAHFQYSRTSQQQSPASTSATVIVEGVFNGGGSSAQSLNDTQDRYEFQEFVSIEHGSHFLRLGGRYRLLRDANVSRANYNGQFIFPDLATYQRALNGETPAEIFASGGGTTQYNLTTGDPSASVLTGDLGVFAEDEWKARKNLTLNYGFRFESQSAVPDHFDPSPRVGFAWAVGQKDKKPPVVTLRGGSGIFYSRFVSTNILTAIRQQSGTTQPSYYVDNPNFYLAYLNSPPPVTELGSVPPTLYNIDPHMRTSYEIISGLTVERGLGKIGSVSLNYLYFRGDHQYLSRNINAPLPDTYNPSDPSSGVRPLGGTQNIYQFSSVGIEKNNILFANAQLQPTKKINLFAFSFFMPSNRTDALGATTFPSNSYNPSVDFGRVPYSNAGFFMGGQLQLPFGVSGGPFLVLQPGAPFNITTGTDLNGDTQYNDRPSFASALSPAASVIHTRYGTFDTTPQPGETIIPVNHGRGPGFIFLSAHVQKEFKFGPRPAPTPPPPGTPAPKGPAPKPDRPYSLSFSVEANNILNHVNPGPPVGVLSSPLFGQSISLNTPFFSGSSSANRTVTLRSSFSF